MQRVCAMRNRSEDKLKRSRKRSQEGVQTLDALDGDVFLQRCMIPRWWVIHITSSKRHTMLVHPFYTGVGLAL